MDDIRHSGNVDGFRESLSRSQCGRYHFLSVLSSVGAHYKEKNKEMNLFMILQSDFLHHIKSNTTLLRAVLWGYEQEAWQYKD